MVAERTEELKELANRDPLTNLHNRRFLYEISDNIILLSKRENTPLSFIMFDLDNFKSINDTYGHAIGHKVIKAFCSENSKYT
jgi:two-component system cell cycle response regulator